MSGLLLGKDVRPFRRRGRDIFLRSRQRRPIDSQSTGQGARLGVRKWHASWLPPCWLKAAYFGFCLRPAQIIGRTFGFFIPAKLGPALARYLREAEHRFRGNIAPVRQDGRDDVDRARTLLQGPARLLIGLHAGKDIVDPRRGRIVVEPRRRAPARQKVPPARSRHADQPDERHGHVPHGWQMRVLPASHQSRPNRAG